jgi:4-amino-4-deoxy-L-arabinose transferase-like glycosyltransferase
MKFSFSEKKISWLCIALLWFFLLLLASLRPLSLPDEGRYADVGRWMLVSGDWLAPRLNGIPFFHKPPLLHWLQALSFSALGVGAWSARLVPAVHAGLMLVAMYLAARTFESERVARNAVLILGSSIGFLISGQYVNHDMLVAAWISMAIWCFALSFKPLQHVDVGMSLLGFAACGLGLLSKGLIGFVLPGFVMVCWLLWTGQLGRLRQMPWVRGILIWGVISLPWFVMGQMKYSELFNYLIVGQHFSRYVGDQFNNAWGWWFYGLVLTAMLFPWSLFILQALRPKAWLTLWRTERTSTARHFESLLWIWTLCICVFFSLPQSKIVGYILPVLPPLACLGALAYERWLDRGRSAALFNGMLVTSLVISGVLNWQAGIYSLNRSSKDVALVLACAIEPKDRVFVTHGYPYDLPFYAQLSAPMFVAINWQQARMDQIDNWTRELYEGANFDQAAGQVLVPESALENPAEGSWLVAPRNVQLQTLSPAWSLYSNGKAWTLYRAHAPNTQNSALESPPAAQGKSLKRCDH